MNKKFAYCVRCKFFDLDSVREVMFGTWKGSCSKFDIGRMPYSTSCDKGVLDE